MSVLPPLVTTVTKLVPASPTSGFPGPVPARLAEAAANSSNNAGIIAGAVLGSVVLVCLIMGAIILLRQQHRRKEGDTSGRTKFLHRHRQLTSGSEGTSPLLAQTVNGHRSTDSNNGGMPSNTMPLIQIVHDSGHDPESGVSGNTTTTTTRNISPPTPLKSIRQRELSSDSVTLTESTYSPAARDSEEWSEQRPAPPVSSLPPQLPKIARTEPLSNMVRVITANNRKGSTRSRSPEQHLQRPGPRTAWLLNAPMAPLMERESSGSNEDSDRWSSAADPGGSRGLTRPTEFGLLTSAFRNSISASSIVTAGSEHNNLHHYPSVVSMGATSGTSSISATSTYYTAHSVEEGRNRSPGMALGMAVTNTSRVNTRGPVSQSPSSRTSLSTFPSTSSLPTSTSFGTNTPPPVPPLPPLPVIHALPQSQSPASSHPDDSIHARAHLRTPSAHRVRADPHLPRAGRSTHGIIDLV